jgi:hypothetical protein
MARDMASVLVWWDGMLILVTRLALPGTPVPAALREDRWLGPKKVSRLVYSLYSLL